MQSSPRQGGDRTKLLLIVDQAPAPSQELFDGSKRLLNSIDFYLLISTFMLGFRHGIDWDHIAAILDFTGSGSIEYSNEAAISGFHHRSVRLATWYALGHAFIVVAFGLLIRALATSMPAWFDNVMERVVGLTLILFGTWIVLAILGSVIFDRPAKFTSRGALMASFIDKLVAAFKNKGEQAHGCAPIGSRRLPAFIIGLIHGAGGETSTQVILLASVAAASNLIMVAGLLVCFTAGLVSSNTLIALGASVGFLSASSMRPLYLGLGVVASAFSVYVGVGLCSGLHPVLPSVGWCGPCLQVIG